MEKQSIINNTLDLPPVDIGYVPNDDKVWQETVGEVQFSVKREKSQDGNVEYYSLCITGPFNERFGIIMDFVGALGRPYAWRQAECNTGGEIYFCYWMIKPKK